MMAATNDGTVGHGALAAAISNGMVGLMHRYTGRGPVRARTTIDENLVVCVLGDTLTKAEQHLVEAGRRKLVLRGRRAIQGRSPTTRWNSSPGSPAARSWRS
jgi:uncharacterized protein YbcI